jgi:site-specific recombinase XerD
VGDKLLNDYTPMDVETFKKYCIEKKLSITSVNMYFRSIKSIFSEAVKLDILDKSPFRNSSTVKVPERRPVYLTKEDLQKLLDAVHNQTLKDLFTVAAYSGLRRSEIIHLKWEHIDFQKSQIHILNNAEFHTKTGKERSVPMHEKVFDILKRRSMKHGTFESYVFCKSGGFRLTECYVTHKFRDYCDKVGLPDTVHLHTLRHTTASFLVNAGVSLYEVQKILGHQDISTTQIYAHIAPSTLQQSINRI